MESIQVDAKIDLKAIRLTDAPIVFKTIHCNRLYLKEWLPFVEATRSVADTELFIKSLIWQKKSRKDEVFTIWYEHEFAGLIGFKDTDWVNRKTELGYWLAEGMQGRGVASKSADKLLQYAFSILDMNRVQLKVAKGNEKSAAIPRRLGFKLEGIEREGELIDGRFHDLKVFSLLKAEYDSGNT